MTNEVYGPETQRSIYEWGQVTFDQPSALSIMSRFIVEMAELNDLLVRRFELKARLHGHPGPSVSMTLQLQEQYAAVEAKIADELADAMVILAQVAEASGVKLEQAMQAKMKVNRARRWEKLEGGRFQHVNGT